MKIKWTKSLATGVEMIDEQHKEFFNRLDVLMNACKSGSGIDEMGELLNFFDVYVRKHFGMEEKYMRYYSYPGYTAHCEAHRRFLADFIEMKQAFLAERTGKVRMLKSIRKVVDWLVNHIGKVDMRMGEYLKDSMCGGRVSAIYSTQQQIGLE